MLRRLLVVAAHPDDETIGAAGLLLQARRAAVVHLTDGAPRDPSLRPGQPDRAAYARLRREEAIAALQEARLAPVDVIALGATDQEAALQLAPLARELARALRVLDPRVVVTHALEGGHPDHDAAALVTRAAIALHVRRGLRPPRLLEMTSYHLGPGGLVTGAFLPGPQPVRTRTLSLRDRAAKVRMLAAYASQREVLAPFGVEVERFRPAAALSLAERPHPPPLHYEAQGWTSFETFRALARAGLDALASGDRCPRARPVRRPTWVGSAVTPLAPAHTVGYGRGTRPFR